MLLSEQGCEGNGGIETAACRVSLQKATSAGFASMWEWIKVEQVSVEL